MVYFFTILFVFAVTNASSEMNHSKPLRLGGAVRPEKEEGHSIIELMNELMTTMFVKQPLAPLWSAKNISDL